MATKKNQNEIENPDVMEDTQEELKNDQADIDELVDAGKSTDDEEGQNEREVHEQRIEEAKREGLRNAANETTEV